MENSRADKRAYMDGLTERLASETFGAPDGELASILRDMAHEQAKERRFRASINLRRAAQLIEEHLKDRPA
jgi:ribosomal protein L18E